MSKKYDALVVEAKRLLKNAEACKYRVAQMALEVCDIRHGGRSEGYYTITDFARDIKIKRRTLARWVHIYRDVLLRTGIKNPTPGQWASAYKVSKAIKAQVTVDNRTKNRVGSKAHKFDRIPNRLIKGAFKIVNAKKDSQEVRQERVYSASKSLLHNVELLNVSRCDQDWLNEVKKIIHEVHLILNGATTVDMKGIANGDHRSH